MTGLAWHYTTGQSFALIVRSGRILPTAVNVPAHEHPAVWFSVRQSYEPTATKMMWLGGRLRELTVGETFRAGAGLYRFGRPAETLVPYHAIREALNIRRVTWKALIAFARRQGSDPGQWFASLEPVPLELCVVERLDACPPHGRWQPLADPKGWAAEQLNHELRAALGTAEAAYGEGAA